MGRRGGASETTELIWVVDDGRTRGWDRPGRLWVDARGLGRGRAIDGGVKDVRVRKSGAPGGELVVGEEAKGDGDLDERTLGEMGEWDLLAHADEGKENGKPLFGGPGGDGTDCRDKIDDANRAEAVWSRSGDEQFFVKRVKGTAEDLKRSTKVVDDSANVRSGFEAVVAVWIGPVAWNAVLWVA